ncbi:MAG: SgcJ/EcaC family oxidoreductase [Rhizomicrobium sp.]
MEPRRRPGFAAAMADDADFIDVLGRHHNGIQAVAEGHKAIFATIYKGSKVAYTVEAIRSLGPLSAVAFLRARLTTTLAGPSDDPNREAKAPGNPREEGARPTLMLQKQGGQWRIAAFQNTRIA